MGFDVCANRACSQQASRRKHNGTRGVIRVALANGVVSSGTVEMFGPDRINQEHDDLLPGCVSIRHGFLGIGGNGGNLFSYCIADGRVYFLESDYFSEDAVYARPWKRMDISPENIKAAAAPESWDSLTLFFDWAISELAKLEAGDESPA